jgi:stearoyl-CoA desaturase (delta-9 desaturase)
VALYHCTFAINSFAHVFGNRRFNTPDQSRNNWLLALLTFGEGWHNNHHFSMASCRQGIRWWEIDFTYYGLRILNVLGIARDLRPFYLPSAPGEAKR